MARRSSRQVAASNRLASIKRTTKLMEKHREEQARKVKEMTPEELDIANGHLAGMVKSDTRTIAELRRELAEAKGQMESLETRIVDDADIKQMLRVERDSARAENERLRDGLAATCGTLVEASSAMESFNPASMTTACLRYTAESCKLTAEHYSRLALATPAADAKPKLTEAEEQEVARLHAVYLEDVANGNPWGIRKAADDASGEVTK